MQSFDALGIELLKYGFRRIIFIELCRLVVCDPRKNALLKDSSKSDRIDARKLAELVGSAGLEPATSCL